MFDATGIPTQTPPLGFYYHHKSASDAHPEDHAYEVMGIGYHTETGEHTVLYRPIHTDAWAYENGKMTYVRPLEMFMGTVEKEGITTPRFIQIIDPEIIETLRARACDMYPL